MRRHGYPAASLANERIGKHDLRGEPLPPSEAVSSTPSAICDDISCQPELC
jgi:hypothetical protein